MITITKQINLSDFETWDGATDTVKDLTSRELEIIEQNIIELYPNGINETELNDILWFERDLIAEWLGYNDYDELLDTPNDER